MWREALESWAIPQEILEQAPENPWIHPPVMFQLPEVIEDSPSHQRARETLLPGSSVLDIGCGGGIAAFALTPPASVVLGVDHQPEMLQMFKENARKRNLRVETFEGFWPEMEQQVPVADVAVAHHVVFNVPEIENFVLSMSTHAKKRVVLELPSIHPLANANELWRHFWNLERPTEPSWKLLMEVLRELDIKAYAREWDGKMRREVDLEQMAHFSRIRLCLPAGRESEVLEFLKANPSETIRKLVTIWWDVE